MRQIYGPEGDFLLHEGDDEQQLSESEVRQLPRAARAVIERQQREADEQRRRIDGWNSAIQDILEGEDRPVATSPLREAVVKDPVIPQRPEVASRQQRRPGNQDGLRNSERGRGKSARKQEAGGSDPDRPQVNGKNAISGGTSLHIPHESDDLLNRDQGLTSAVEQNRQAASTQNPPKRRAASTSSQKLPEKVHLVTQGKDNVQDKWESQERPASEHVGTEDLLGTMRANGEAGKPFKQPKKRAKKQAGGKKANAEVEGLAGPPTSPSAGDSESKKDAADSLAEYLAEVENVLNEL